MKSWLRSLVTRAYQTAHGAQDVPEITIEDLKRLLDDKEEVYLLAVREAYEHDRAHIQGDHLIPLMQLPERAKDIDKSKTVVAYCDVGGRSARAAKFLRKSGFESVLNLAGGIVAWAEKIDPDLDL